MKNLLAAGSAVCVCCLSLLLPAVCLCCLSLLLLPAVCLCCLSRRDDSFVPKIVEKGAILAIFRPFEDFSLQ